MDKEDIQILEKRIGEEITIELLTPNQRYTGTLIGYDGEHLIFDEDGKRAYVSKHNVRFPN